MAEFGGSKRRINLTPGQKIGFWTLLSKERAYTASQQSYIRWYCRCECGTEKYVKQRSLFEGRTLSCGCITKGPGSRERAKALKERALAMLAQQYPELMARQNVREKIKYKGYLELASGQSIAYWTLIISYRNKRHAFWHCRCKCGAEGDVPAVLVSLKSLSCGCLRKGKGMRKRYAEVRQVALRQLTAIGNRGAQPSPKNPAEQKTNTEQIILLRSKTPPIVNYPKSARFGSAVEKISRAACDIYEI